MTATRHDDRPREPGIAHGTSLVDLLDRVVDKGAVVNGDVIIQLAGIDLLRLDLRLLLIGVESATELASAAQVGRGPVRGGPDVA